MSVALIQPSRIDFYEEGHRYLVDGAPKRSLSEILAPLIEMPDHPKAQEYIRHAKHRGSQVHDGCALLMEGRDFGDIMAHAHKESRPYIAAYREFWQHLHVVGDPHIETPLYCRTLDFCCTPDWDDLNSVNDIKTTDRCSRVWGLQSAGQQMAHGLATVRRIIWLRPKLKTRQYDVHTDHEGDRRIFSPLDYQVVEAACQGDYDADVIRRWRAGE